MKCITMWEAEDGTRFSSEGACREYEVKQIEKAYGITYYDSNEQSVDNYDQCWIIVFPKKLEESAYDLLKGWYGWNVPNDAGEYRWSDITDKWELVS